MNRVLLVTHSHFWRHQNGAAARISTLVSVLQASGREVGLFFVGRMTPEDHVALDDMVIKNRVCIPDGAALTYHGFMPLTWSAISCLPRYFLKLWYRLRNKSFPFFRFRQRGIEKRFDDFLAAYDPEVVLVEYIRLSFLLRKGDSNCLWIIDTHDVMHRRYERFVSRGLVHWVAISREEEACALQGFDLVLAIQEEEAEVLKEMLNSDKVLVVPHGVIVEPVPERKESDFCVGYIGADNAVNFDAISWFLEQVWPIIRERFPMIRFSIAGQICRRLSGRTDRGVELLGRVDNLQSYYASVNVLVNPVRSGGGLKIKNVEALAAGIPLVTTEVGAEGFPMLGKLPFIIARSEKEFIEGLSKLILDKQARRSFRRNGIDYAKRSFSFEASFKPLLRYLLNDLG